MAANAKRLILFFVFLLGMLGLHASPIVPAIYIFGDSTVDVGTNNYLQDSGARADFPFNGIDFPNSMPTGRFSNGYNVIDYIATFLGYKMSPPPFLSLLDKYKQFPKYSMASLILRARGVNFASGGSGLLEDTGRRKWGKVIRFGEQVQQFATVRSNISELLGHGAVCNISKSLFLISVGGNDIFEYFAFNQNTSPPDFITTIMSTYESRLRNIFDLGARRFAIISVPPVGCVPFQRNFTETGGCLDPMNDLAQLFYNALEGLLQKLSSECKGMKYALADAYKMTNIILNSPRKYGFKEVTKACCGKGNFNAELPCRPDSVLCSYRKDYLFWDQFHPTQAASFLAALALYNGTGGGDFVKPMTFGQLALLP